MSVLKWMEMDEKEALADLVQHEGFRSLCRVMDRVVSDSEQKVFQTASQSSVVPLRDEAVGAKKAVAEIVRLLGTLRTGDNVTVFRRADARTKTRRE